ncbi:MAG: transglutaminase domain-containing protein [Myxococcota bacterium]|nr:transglutaminase domain-containing protein [Myxococcota bacterium]
MTLTALVTAVLIVKKNLRRAFDFASVVARRAEGDCTEHAVLLAALARSFQIPTRVVLGLALVEGKEGLKAFGHAWVEYRDGKHWRPADAALRGVTELQYLPLNVLEDESASYLGVAIRQGSLMAVQGLLLEDGPPGG